MNTDRGIEARRTLGALGALVVIGGFWKFGREDEERHDIRYTHPALSWHIRMH